jgi:hypothetical protein
MVGTSLKNLHYCLSENDFAAFVHAWTGMVSG